MGTITHHTRHVNGIRMHYVIAGDGPPVFLLHGFPETWFAWRKQMHYRLIVPDLRGYGDTDKPPPGYDKRTMARDIYELMKSLGYDRAAMIGHDRGARVATRFAKDYPDATYRLAVLVNILTRVIFERMDAGIARGHGLFSDVSESVVVIDTCNYYPERDGRIDEILAGKPESQWVEQQIGHPVVKAFNNIRAQIVMRLVGELGFDEVDAGGLSESWRQQPGTPVYTADKDAEGVRRVAGGEQRAAAGVSRSLRPAGTSGEEV